MRTSISLTIIGLILFVCAQAQVPVYVPSQGLLAWYSFSGNSQDLSGNGNNLTNNGATLTADRYGNSNSAYQFNGTSGYLVNTTPSYIMYDTSSFTLSVWVYRPSTTYGVYIMHGSTVGGNFNYNIQGSATGITNFGANKQGLAWIWCTAPYSSGIWEHFAGTYENMVLKLYKNGVLISTNNYTHTNVNATTLPFYIGRGVSGNYVAATLDDIGVWGRALSPGEIWDMYMACSNNLITNQPLSQTANLLDDALFTVAATPGAGYQWQAHSGSGIFNDIYDGGQFSGTVTDSLTISDVTLANQGTWVRCVVFEGTCVDTSDPVMLSVDCIPAISVQPVSQTVAAWTTASFPLSVVDPQAVLQWQQKNGNLWNDLTEGGMYSGTQTATLMVSGVQLSNSGEQYRCVADLLGCPDTSDVVTLTVSPQVGLPDASVNATVGVYPSPSDGQFTIEVGPQWLGATYVIYDAASRKVAGGTLDRLTTRLELTHLMPGTYVLRVSGAGEVVRTVVIR